MDVYEIRDTLSNFYVRAGNLARGYGFVAFPIISSLVVFLCFKTKLLIYPNETVIASMVNLSGVFIGFLFTTVGILLALPDTKFRECLVKYGYLYAVYRMMFIAILLFVCVLLLGIFQVQTTLLIILFVSGLTELINSTYFFYQIASLFSKEKKM